MPLYSWGFLIMVAVFFAGHSNAEQVCTNLKNVLSQRKSVWIPALLSGVKSSDVLLSCVKNCTVLPTCKSYRFHTTDNRCQLLNHHGKQLAVQGRKTEIDPSTTESGQEMCARQDYIYLNSSKTCVKLYKQRLTWMKAVEFCRGLNGTLAIIKSKQKRRAIAELMKNLRAGNTWIGAKIDDRNRNFIWNDGFPIYFASGYWSFGEPSSYRNRILDLPLEGCVQLLKRTKYKLNDEICSHTESFLCEFNLGPVS